MNNRIFLRTVVTFTLLLFAFTQSHSQPKTIITAVNAANINWNAPGLTPARSMPTGNGDISLNAWVEANGDICFFIAKRDALGVLIKNNKVVKDSSILMKLSKVRISLNPSPLIKGAPFVQLLKLAGSEVLVKEGTTELRVWVDTNNPVIRVETKSNNPTEFKVTLHNPRIGMGDYVVNNQSTRITWYHQNAPGSGAKLEAITFGAMIKGGNMVSRDDTTLVSRAPVTAQQIAIYPLTTSNRQTSVQWLAQMSRQAQVMDALNLEQTRKAHQKWWNKFWTNSPLFEKNNMIPNIDSAAIVQSYVNSIGNNMAVK